MQKKTKIGLENGDVVNIVEAETVSASNSFMNEAEAEQNTGGSNGESEMIMKDVEEEARDEVVTSQDDNNDALEKSLEYDKCTNNDKKKSEKREMKREQKVRNAQSRLRETFFGRERDQVIEKTLIVSLENGQGTNVQVENTNSRLIYNVLEKYINPKDITEIRMNKTKQKATLEVKSSEFCLPASKTFIERLEQKEEIKVELGNQVSWTVKIIQRSAIGVIRGVPVNEGIDDIQWLCEERGFRVRSIRKLGPTVVSIQFDGSLPSHIWFPFSYGNQATKVEPFIPGPRHCMKCFGFGHMAMQCKGPLRCAKCGGDNHLAATCTGKTPKCPNCGGKHGPLWNECPVNQDKKAKKKEIISKKKIEEKEIEREAFQGILGGGILGSNSRSTDLDVGSEGVWGTESRRESEVNILGKLEEILEQKLRSFERTLESMIDQMGEKIVKLFENRLKKNESITDENVNACLTRGIDTVVEGKLESMAKNVFEKVFGQAPYRTFNPDEPKSLRGGSKKKK